MGFLISAFRWLAAAESPFAAVLQTLTSRFAIIAINLGTSVVVARSLGPAGRGAAAAISLWPIMFCALTTFGIPTALRYHVRRNPENGDRLFSVSLLLGAISSAIALLAGAVAVPRLLQHYSQSVETSALLMLLFIPQITCNNLLQAFLESRGDFTHSNRIQYMPPAMTLLALLVLHANHYLFPLSVALSYFVPTVFVTVWTAYKLRRSIFATSDFLPCASLLLHYGSRAYGLNVLSTLSAQVDQAIIIGFMSASSFGLYGVALNVAAMLGIPANSLNIVLFPKACAEQRPEALAMVFRAARIIFCTTLIALLCCLALLPTIIRLFYGDAYTQVIEIADVLMVEVLLSSTSSTLSQAFLATGRPGTVTIFQAIGLLCALPLMLLLIPRFGLLGAAYALVLSTCIRLISLLLSVPLFLNTAIPSLLITREDFRILTARLRRATTA